MCRYLSVGSYVVFTMLIYPMTNRIYPTIPPLWLFIRRLFDMRSEFPNCYPLFSTSFTQTAVQAELDALYIGDEFPVEIQYASVVTVIMTCVTFGSGMPILYPICCFSLMLIFFMDKVRTYCTYKPVCVECLSLSNLVCMHTLCSVLLATLK